MKKTEELKIEVNSNTVWKELKQVGDFSCPICKDIMIVIGGFDIPYAFCPKCKKYWMG